MSATASTASTSQHNYLITRGGQKISYDFLVVAAGIQLNWDGIPGLKKHALPLLYWKAMLKGRV